MKVEDKKPVEGRARFEPPIQDDRPMLEAIARQQTWKDALELWLRWNESYEHVTAEAFAAGGDPRHLEDLMDEMDQVRQQALDLTRRLLVEP